MHISCKKHHTPTLVYFVLNPKILLLCGHIFLYNSPTSKKYGTDDIPKMTGRSSGASETDINASDAGGNDVARKQEADSAASGDVELNPCETTYYGAQSGRGTVGRAKLDVLMSGVTDVFVGVLEPTYATLYKNNFPFAHSFEICAPSITI